jgi:hypothetical protein
VSFHAPKLERMLLDPHVSGAYIALQRRELAAAREGGGDEAA